MKRLDVHHHAFPERYVRALKGAGVEYSMGVDFPSWTPDVSLKQVDKNQITVSGKYALNALRDSAGPEHIVFGTDLCMSKLPQIITKNLKRDGDFSVDEHNAIAYGNSLRLFPAFSEHFEGSEIDEAA